MRSSIVVVFQDTPNKQHRLKGKCIYMLCVYERANDKQTNEKPRMLRKRTKIPAVKLNSKGTYKEYLCEFSTGELLVDVSKGMLSIRNIHINSAIRCFW